MYLTHLRPAEIQDAVRRNVPVLMAAGSVEYHGPHLPIGTDYLIADAVVREVEQRCECVVAPGLPFSSTLSWAAGPEEGEVDFEPEALFIYAREVLRGIAGMGFQRIYILQHHQGSEGLPVLCLKRAAMEVVRETTRLWGGGWGRKPYAGLPLAPFGWIRVAYIDSFSEYLSPEAERMPIGHGGKGETQLIQAAWPATVAMGALDTLAPLPEWLMDADQADAAEGRRWIEFCAEGWATELRRGVVALGVGGSGQ